MPDSTLGGYFSRPYYQQQDVIQRVTAISKIKLLETIQELRRFLGLINFYCPCIEGAAKMQAPLSTFLKDGKCDKRKIVWSAESEAAFEECKSSIANAALLAHPGPKRTVGTRNRRIRQSNGASLQQKKDSIWKPLGFFSRKLSPSEQRYSAYGNF